MAEDDYKGRSGAASYSARRVSSPTGMDRPGGHPGRDTTGSGGSSSSGRDWDQEAKNRESGGKRKSNNERAADRLLELQRQGLGNSTQAQDIKWRLASVDAKAEQFHASGRKMSFDEKMDLAYGGKLPGHLQSNMQAQVKDYQDNPPKLVPKEITLADGTKMMTYSSFEPGQFAGNQYADVLKYGIKPTDPSTSYMDFGFGSVFGASSGSTASSPAVQQSLTAMMQDLYDKGYSQSAASQIAMDKMYPGYLDYTSGKIDPATGEPYAMPVNFMDMPTPNEFTTPHKMVMDYWRPEVKGDVYHGGWGSGWGGGYGGGGGGGGSGGGYGFSMQQDPMQQGYQRGKVGPGTLQEQVNQIYLGMSNLNAAPGFNKNRGGIVSLVQ